MEWAGLPFLFLSMFLSYVWEEIGWRGFALPRLQQRYSALVASLIMGALAFLWHLPLTFNRDLPAALPTTPAGLLIDLVFAIAITVWYTWLYNNSGGSLWPASIFHAALNTSAGVTMAVAGAEGFTAQYVPATLIYTALAILITLAYGPATLTRRVRAESAPSRAA
ncbi:MAG TPA: CPBP family intramembrane metalloprotease [Chloroflexi bacterium]|nr:CPBP family intramembrane metalloprotease [Chloroflexota bacterium]